MHSLHSLSAGRAAELLRLANPHGCLWRGETPVLIPLGHDDAAKLHQPGRTPLLFVHGMEYHDRTEVIRDLVQPFETEARLCQQPGAPRFDYLFVHWDSRLDGHTSLPLFPLNALCRNIRRLGASALRWDLKLSSLEARAHTAALDLQRLVAPLFDGITGCAPVVISHSLGALVWSETLKAMLQNGHALNAPGIWWNLQPAIAANAFSPRGAYDFVPELYRRQGARLEVWHSRLDIVLGTLFLGAKRTLAMGQVGLCHRTEPTRRARLNTSLDLTGVVREAHGQTVLVKPAGPFFRRASRHVFHRAQQL